MKNDLWILIFSIMYPVHPGGRWVSAQSTMEPPVYQLDNELIVEIGGSATLRCCVSEQTVGSVAWFKQPNGNKPQLMLKVYRSVKKEFYTESQPSRFQIKTYGNCFNATILQTQPSDEAMYYCASSSPYTVFGNGTRLKIKETSKAALCDNPVLCGPTANINAQEKTERELVRSLHGTVLGLGTALGLCALLIICLVYFLLRRKESDEINSSREDSPGTRQESEADAMNYAALKFSKKRSKGENRKTGPSDECVYSDVNTTVRHKINNNS